MTSFFNKWKIRLYKIIFICHYYLFHHRRMIEKLSSYGMSEIKTFDITQWLRIIRGRKIVRYLYRAQLHGETCFVKVGKKGMFMDNEIAVNEHINSYNITFIPRLLISDKNFDNDKSMIVTEFLTGIRRIVLPNDEKTFEHICSQLESIHAGLQEIGVIHGDLTAANVLLNEENHIQMIDFGVAWLTNAEIIEMTRAFGRNYLLSEDVLIYDNAYSFLKLLDNIGISDERKKTECYRRLESLVGKHTKVFHYSKSESQYVCVK